jgi:hypothetical protein
MRTTLLTRMALFAAGCAEKENQAQLISWGRCQNAEAAANLTVHVKHPPWSAPHEHISTILPVKEIVM